MIEKLERRRVSRFVLISVVAGMAIGFFIGGEMIHRIYMRNLGGILNEHAHRLEPRERDGPEWTAGEPAAGSHRVNAIIWATRKVAPSVVGIVVTQIQVVSNPSNGGSSFFDYFFAPDMKPLQYRKIENIGSGFVISADGLILTNYHVVQNASKLFVNFQDGRRIEGKVVGADEKSDLAVVSVQGRSFKPAQFGNSDRCLIGEWSIALGNPFLNFINDAHPTVTVGVISALNRNFAPSEGVYYQSMIQTDAAINPGNSGGPLVNVRGEVVGINSFIYTGSSANTGSIGISFAIPINRARRVAQELIAHGRRRQIWTGISVHNVNRGAAAALNMNSGIGVAISSVKPQSPGEVAGLKAGDVITRMGRRIIHNNADLDGFFLDYYVGDTVGVQYIRGGKYMRTDIVLQEYPSKK